MLLHKEHGLNPTMPQCIICGNDKGEIALLGASYKGEAPMKMVVDIEPCKDCRVKYLSKGTILVEADVDYKGNKTPTGKLSVLKDTAFSKMFNVKPPKQKIAFVEVGLLQKIGALK